MSTSSDNGQVTPQAIGVHIAGNLLRIGLNDGRELKVWVDQAPWLKWLSGATPDQQERWSIEPQGFAVYWEDLDDGVEISHLLEMASANNATIELSLPPGSRFDPFLVGPGEALSSAALESRAREAEYERHVSS